ncbi:MAG TPA: ATP-binding protein [Bryobacteraceae bacterium]|nr:ATP-binding protein [Bryobacteraceae bacterium]
MNTQDAGSIGEPAAVQRRDMISLLNKGERMVVALLESASQAIVSIDREGKIVLANPRTEEMFAYTREELLDHDIELLLPETKRVTHSMQRTDYFNGPHVRPMGIGMELSGRRKDGSEFPVEVSLSYVEIEEGLFAIAFVSDISQRKTLEEQLQHAQKMEAVGRLAGGVAHDFNNMLTVISGYNRMLLDELSPLDPLRSYVEEALTAADRAAELTNQLLAFSRRQIMQPKVINVNTVVRQSDKMLRRLIGEDIELVFLLKDDVGNIKVDPGHLDQAIINLAVNSRDAMPLGGRLTVETANVHLDENYARSHVGVKPGEFVMIAVSDNGTGMDASTRQHIFEPFFTTKEKGKGTGLGLATVYGTVKQAGGDIWVYSEPGRGTTFKLYFPRVMETSTETPREEPARLAQSLETVLVVEDEQSVRDLTVKMLQKLGYRILTAASGAEAIEISCTHPGRISLLLTDVVMPNMSGRQLADVLRPQRPDMKVLFLSGYTEDTIVHHGVLDENVQFLPKPFSREVLAKKIRDVLGK